MSERSGAIVVARTEHHEQSSKLLSIIGNSRVKISLLSDGTLVSDRNDPLASTNEGVDLHGAKFQYFFPDEKYFFVYRLITLLTVLSALIFFATIVEWSERMSSDDIGLNSINFFEHLQYFSPIGIWIFSDLFRGRIGTQERLIIRSRDGQTIEICGELPTKFNTTSRCIC